MSRTIPLGIGLRRSAALLATLVLGASACPKTPPPAAPPPVEAPPQIPPLQQATTDVFEAWLSSHPVQATALGEHRYDGAWPKLGPADLAADLALKIRNTDLTLRQYQLELMYSKGEREK